MACRTLDRASAPGGVPPSPNPSPIRRSAPACSSRPGSCFPPRSRGGVASSPRPASRCSEGVRATTAPGRNRPRLHERTACGRRALFKRTENSRRMSTGWRPPMQHYRASTLPPTTDLLHAPAGHLFDLFELGHPRRHDLEPAVLGAERHLPDQVRAAILDYPSRLRACRQCNLTQVIVVLLDPALDPVFRRWKRLQCQNRHLCFDRACIFFIRSRAVDESEVL